MYKKLIESKIVRITHQVSFYEGTSALDLMESLKSVPMHSRVTDADMEDSDGTISIFFREEKEEKK
jgi:hypothetical protein